MTPKLATAAAILLMCLGGCSANAPMAPIGLDKYPANGMATIRALTGSDTAAAAGRQQNSRKDSNDGR